MSSYTVRNRLAIEIEFNNGAPSELSLELIRGADAPRVFVLGQGSDIVEAGPGLYRYSLVPGDSGQGQYRVRWFGKDSQGVEFAAPQEGTSRYETFRVY